MIIKTTHNEHNTTSTIYWEKDYFLPGMPEVFLKIDMSNPHRDGFGYGVVSYDHQIVSTNLFDIVADEQTEWEKAIRIVIRLVVDYRDDGTDIFDTHRVKLLADAVIDLVEIFGDLSRPLDTNMVSERDEIENEIREGEYQYASERFCNSDGEDQWIGNMSKAERENVLGNLSPDHRQRIEETLKKHDEVHRSVVHRVPRIDNPNADDPFAD